ncbi:hypothetical protein MRX96_016414 [Rhipicephalus microplus]
MSWLSKTTASLPRMKERLGKLSVRGTARFESTHAETERQRVLLHAGSECDVSALEAATKDGTGVTRKRLSIIANPIASRLLRRPRLSFASSTLIGVVAEEEAGKLTPPPPLPSHHPYPQSPHAISQRVPLRWCGSRCVSTGSRLAGIFVSVQDPNRNHFPVTDPASCVTRYACLLRCFRAPCLSIDARRKKSRLPLRLESGRTLNVNNVAAAAAPGLVALLDIVPAIFVRHWSN